MVAHQLAPHASQRFVDRRDLRHHVRAIPVVLDHLLQPTHLPFDSAQTLEVARLDAGIDRDRFARAPPRCVGANLARAVRHHVRVLHGFHRRSRRLLLTTLTELRAIAALATTGLSSRPNFGYSTPAAIGMPMTL